MMLQIHLAPTVMLIFLFISLITCEKVPVFRRSILHVINAPESGVVLTVAVIVKRQTSARFLISNLK